MLRTFMVCSEIDGYQEVCSKQRRCQELLDWRGQFVGRNNQCLEPNERYDGGRDNVC